MSRKFKIEPVNLEDYVDIRPVKKVKKNNYKNDAIKMISHKIKCGECQIIFELQSVSLISCHCCLFSLIES